MSRNIPCAEFVRKIPVTEFSSLLMWLVVIRQFREKVLYGFVSIVVLTAFLEAGNMGAKKEDCGGMVQQEAVTRAGLVGLLQHCPSFVQELDQRHRATDSAGYDHAHHGNSKQRGCPLERPTTVDALQMRADPNSWRYVVLPEQNWKDSVAANPLPHPTDSAFSRCL